MEAATGKKETFNSDERNEGGNFATRHTKKATLKHEQTNMQKGGRTEKKTKEARKMTNERTNSATANTQLSTVNEEFCNTKTLTCKREENRKEDKGREKNDGEKN